MQKIMIIGDVYTRNEALAQRPFLGLAGKELRTMLAEAGIDMDACHVTVVHPHQPRGDVIETLYLKNTKAHRVPTAALEQSRLRIHEEIARVNPNVILALGDLTLWAVTGELGIGKWRGSHLTYPLNPDIVVIPTYTPAQIIRMWQWRFMVVSDFGRAVEYQDKRGLLIPAVNYRIAPGFAETVGILDMLIDRAGCGVAVAGRLTVGDTHTNTPDERPHMAHVVRLPDLILGGDIETRLGHITCFGIAWSETDAICIPFTCLERDHYWSEVEEVAIMERLWILFTSPRVGWVFQNGLYDFQYFAKLWGFIPHLYMDTMLAHHTCFAGMLKSLDFQSSLFCKYHRYWKDEGKDFHKAIKTVDDQHTYWVYNGKDCCIMYELIAVHKRNIAAFRQEEPYDFQLKQFYPVLRMMLRGVRMDTKAKSSLSMEMFHVKAEMEQWIDDVVGHPLNLRSPKQVKEFFYEELALPVIRNRKTGKPTTNEAALEKIGKKEPLIKPLTDMIMNLRSAGVFLSTFVNMKLDKDQRARSSYNIAGAETFRWTSSGDAFGYGGNLQNIPKGDKE